MSGQEAVLSERGGTSMAGSQPTREKALSAGKKLRNLGEFLSFQTMECPWQGDGGAKKHFGGGGEPTSAFLSEEARRAPELQSELK